MTLWFVIGGIVAGCDVKVGDKGMSFDVVQGRAGDEWTRTYTLPKGGRLEIVNVNGPIQVFPSTGAAVEVRVKREVRTRSDETAQQLLRKLTILEEVTPDRVRVESPRTGDEFRAFGRNAVSTEYRVNVPAGLQISLKTENGDVRLENVEGALVAGSTNGSVRGRGVTGSLEATTVNGIVEVDLAQVTGDIKATTVNGPVRIGLPQGLNATLDATAVNGGVAIGEQVPFTATTRERLHVAGRVGNGGPLNIVLQTTNGPVRVGVTGRPGREGGPVRRELEPR